MGTEIELITARINKLCTELAQAREDPQDAYLAAVGLERGDTIRIKKGRDHFPAVVYGWSGYAPAAYRIRKDGSISKQNAGYIAKSWAKATEPEAPK